MLFYMKVIYFCILSPLQLIRYTNWLAFNSGIFNTDDLFFDFWYLSQSYVKMMSRRGGKLLFVITVSVTTMIIKTPQKNPQLAGHNDDENHIFPESLPTKERQESANTNTFLLISWRKHKFKQFFQYTITKASRTNSWRKQLKVLLPLSYETLVQAFS